jgi:NAD+ diphosphatase
MRYERVVSDTTPPPQSVPPASPAGATERQVAPFVPVVTAPVDAPPLARWYLVRTDEVLVDDDGALPALAKNPADLGFSDTEEPVVMGWSGDTLCWAAGVGPDDQAPPGHRWAPLRAIGGDWSHPEWALAGRAIQLVEWRRTSRYCGRCGTPTVASPGERAVRCPNCGLLAYPRLAPAIIVLVRRGDRALLASGRNFRGGMQSALAGFVEPGENLEEAVHREVGEEVGVALKNLRYVGSQPWPFPHSLMLAFTAEWAGGDIQVDGEEILEAAWRSVDDLPPIPPSISIARTLIDAWVREIRGATPA